MGCCESIRTECWNAGCVKTTPVSNAVFAGRTVFVGLFLVDCCSDVSSVEVAVCVSAGQGSSLLTRGARGRHNPHTHTNTPLYQLRQPAKEPRHVLRSISSTGVKKKIAPSHHVQSGSKPPRFYFKLSQAQQYITQIHSPRNIEISLLLSTTGHVDFHRGAA